MGSSGKKRATMAKLNRESKLRDKRIEKQARKVARKSSAGVDPAPASSGEDFDATWSEPDATSSEPDAGVSDLAESGQPPR